MLVIIPILVTYATTVLGEPSKPPVERDEISMKCSVEHVGKPEEVEEYKWSKIDRDNNDIVLSGLRGDRLVIQVGIEEISYTK